MLLAINILILWVLHCSASTHYYFQVKEAPYTRLCYRKRILTVNGEFPGPTLHVHKGDTIFVTVHNRGRHNISIHWHGVKQPRNPWSDGPEYVTQCPIQPGAKFKQKVIFSAEEGTLWWHAHSDWSRATVHGAIIVYPKYGTYYPFPSPDAEVPVILGEWWKRDVMEVFMEFLMTGGGPQVSDAFTINGQPGDLNPCSRSGTFRLTVTQGKTYLLRMINAAMNDILFVSIAKHSLTVVGADGSYTKPLTTNYIAIGPGQTIDALLNANQDPNHYYMAASSYTSNPMIPFDNTTATALVQYKGTHSPSSTPTLPLLPDSNDTEAAYTFFNSLRSLGSKDHPIQVPLDISANILTTISLNTFPCPRNSSCEGPNGTRLAASMNDISFVNPSIDILEAYYWRINGVFGYNFPSYPPLVFNSTEPILPLVLQIPRKGTEAKVLAYDSSVEIVFQGTNILGGIDHPMHVHGYRFYVVGWGLGNFDREKDPQKYNLVDPPFRNTVCVPINGWVAIRFKAYNPGVWLMHCHLESHFSWGMETLLIVSDGMNHKERLLPPPPHMPPC